MQKTLLAAALAASLVLPTVGAQAGSRSEHSVSSLAGMASYYHDRFHGHRTASGARYDKNSLSAAHKTLPLGTKVRVTNTSSGESVVVRINDRGPYARGRVIDLSRAAAREIGLIRKGVARVRLDIVDSPKHLDPNNG